MSLRSSQNVSCVAMSARPGLSILHSVTQARHGGRLTFVHPFSLFYNTAGGGGRGGRDCDGWCWDAFSYWPEQPDHIVSYQEECPVKTCQYDPLIISQKVACASGALWLAAANWSTCLNANCIYSTGISVKQQRHQSCYKIEKPCFPMFVQRKKDWVHPFYVSECLQSISSADKVHISISVSQSLSGLIGSE